MAQLSERWLAPARCSSALTIDNVLRVEVMRELSLLERGHVDNLFDQHGGSHLHDLFEGGLPVVGLLC